MADPYKTLGVARGADDAAIKKAYRKLAKELHPDRNADNPKAAERFSAVTAAYDLLSDKAKRARFDRGEIDADGNPTAPFGFGGGGAGGGGGNPFGGARGFRAGAGPGGAAGMRFEENADFGSIFDDLFSGGAGGGAQGAGGGGPFGGFGRRGGGRPQAKGADVAYRLQVSFEDAAALKPQRVALANGKTIELKLPAGIETGTQRRLSGQGEPGPAGPGDAIVTIEISPHRFFTRDGDDVRLDLPVGLSEAVLGAKVKVPTVDGAVMVTVPKGSTSGRTLRLGGKGFHRPGGGRGDQLVTLTVDVPADDAALEAFLADWPGDRARNPGRRWVSEAAAGERTPDAGAAGRHSGGPRWFAIVRQVAGGVYADGFIHAGNIAYLSLLALFPFFIIVTALAQLFGRSDEGTAAIESFLHVMPRNVADLLRPAVSAVLASRTGPLLWFGAIVGLWTVGSFVETIRDILRRAYGARFSAPFWSYRLWSVAIIVGSVLLMFIAFAAQIALVAAEQVIDRFFPLAQQFVGWINLSRLLPGVLLFVALYVLFYALTPSRFRYGRHPKWPGALLTAAWWLTVTAGLPWVLAWVSYDLTYGSLAGVIVALLFFWLVGLGLVTGAHLNAALAQTGETALKGVADARAD